jgi:hypothetical protein
MHTILLSPTQKVYIDGLVQKLAEAQRQSQDAKALLDTAVTMLIRGVCDPAECQGYLAVMNGSVIEYGPPKEG